MTRIDPELRRLYGDALRAGNTLAARIENYEGLHPARKAESELVSEMARFALLSERLFRGLYERCRDAREMFEDPDLQYPEGEAPPTPDPDPRDG